MHVGSYDSRRDDADVIGDNDDLELKRFTVLEKLAGLNTIPERGTLLSAREYTLNQLVSQLRMYT
jgi:hypothetical protein